MVQPTKYDMRVKNTLICFLFSLLFVTLSSLSSCHRKHEPCPGTVTNTSADFTVAQTNGSGTVDLVCDTCLQGLIKFTLKDQSAEIVKWKIGTDPTIYTEKSFTLQFEDSIAVLPITCIVSKNPDKKCFPYDDGADTITKVISIKGFYNRLYYGTFRGYNEDNPTHYFDVSFIRRDSMSCPGTYCSYCDWPYYEFTIHNLPEGEETGYKCFLPTFNLGTYKSFYVGGEYTGLGPGTHNLQIDGKGQLDKLNKDKIVIEYSYIPDSTPLQRVYKKFIGLRQ